MRTQLAVCRIPWPCPEPESALRDTPAAGSAPQVDEQDSARALREAALARCGLSLEHCLRPHGRLDASLVAALRVLAAGPAELAAVAVMRVVAQRKAIEEQRTQVWQRPVRQENLALGGMISDLV
jgi:hypothetical protein